jgi:hypothetical protein
MPMNIYTQPRELTELEEVSFRNKAVWLVLGQGSKPNLRFGKVYLHLPEHLEHCVEVYSILQRVQFLEHNEIDTAKNNNLLYTCLK